MPEDRLEVESFVQSEWAYITKLYTHLPADRLEVESFVQ